MSQDPLTTSAAAADPCQSALAAIARLVAQQVGWSIALVLDADSGAVHAIATADIATTGGASSSVTATAGARTATPTGTAITDATARSSIGPSVIGFASAFARASADADRFELTDARLDARLDAEPCVAGAPHVRACCGVALHGDGGGGGRRLGTLLLLHDAPARLSPVQDAALHDAATAAAALLAAWKHRREPQRQLAAVLAASPDLWLQLDRAGRYVGCSDEHHPALLEPFSDSRGRLIDDVLPPPVAARGRAAFDASLASDRPQRFEYTLALPDGARQFEARFVAMGCERVLCSVRDLTGPRAPERDGRLRQRASGAPGAPGVSSPTIDGARAPDLQASAVAPRDVNERQRDASAGRPDHGAGPQRDANERRRPPRQVDASEPSRPAAAAVADGLLVLDARGAVVSANPAACALLGRPLEALVGTGSQQLGVAWRRPDGSPLPHGDDPVAEVLRGGPNVVGRVLGLRRPDGADGADGAESAEAGSVISLSAHRLPASGAGTSTSTGASAKASASTGTAPLSSADASTRRAAAITSDPDADRIACIVTLRDITEQRAAERRFAHAEARWRFALEEAGDGLLDYDDDRQRTFFSPRWKAMLGYTHPEIGTAPQEWSHRIHPKDHRQVMHAYWRYHNGEAPEYRSEHRLRHKNGHWVWVLDRAKIIERRADGSVRRVIGVHTDITRLKAAEHAVRDKRAAELASSAKSEFLSRMSHEMRTPLNAVIGFAQLLHMRGAAGRPVPIAQYSEHILQSGRHLLALVNDVLDLQQVEAGRSSMALEAVALGAALESARLGVETAARARAITIELQAEPGLQVSADPRRLQQVLLNLMSNAVKYNRSGGTVRCSVHTADAQHAVLTIDDTGAGLSADELARLFQPFERLGRESSGVEGTGLGLVIARALVREMAGTLTMTSERGTGTRVRVELPLAAAAHRSAAITLPQPRPTSVMRVLYVEDNRLNALLFEEAIKLRGGVELRVVDDGPDALALLADWPADVLVLDAHLPTMSGYEVLSRLRELPRFLRTPAFMCSADALPSELARAQAAGFLGYWTKPIDIAQVMRDLDALPAA